MGGGLKPYIKRSFTGSLFASMKNQDSMLFRTDTTHLVLFILVAPKENCKFV